MAKAEKVLRVNVPFRVLPITLEQLNEIAEKERRTAASALEIIIEDLHAATFGKPAKKSGKK